MRSLTASSPDLGGGRKEGGKFKIEPGLLGFVNSCYQLGSIFAVPIAPWFAQKYGRRWSIMLGSWIMVVGAIIQGFAQHGMLPIRFSSSPVIANKMSQSPCTSSPA
jgi:MFS family permease